MNTVVNHMNSVYLHLETDAEFCSRMSAMYARLAPHIRDLRGADLDDYVWNSCKMQRKLIEVVP